MRALLIDDEQLSLEVTEIMLKKIDGIEIVGKYTDPYVALKQLEKVQVDVIFLDMEMGEVHGLKLAEEIKGQYSHIEILFLTAHPKYALEAFEVNAIDYLLKPVNMARLKKAVTKAKEKIDLYHASKTSLMDLEQSYYAYTIGSFRLQNCERQDVKWRTKKGKELFVFLWHNRETPVHKSIILEALWPEMSVSKSVTLLHTTVYQLRRTLKENGMENPIELVNDHYLLSFSLGSDFNELEELLKSKKVEPSNVEKILEMYTRDYLEDEDYRWAIFAQQSMKQTVLRYLERFTYIENSYLVETCLKKMLELDMYNENYMFKLMEYYGQTNNISKLKALYQTIVDRLRSDLGVGVPKAVEESYKTYIK